MVKIKKFNENISEKLFDLEESKNDIKQLNKIYSNLFDYVDILLEYSDYCVFRKKKDGEYFIPYLIEVDHEFNYEIYHDAAKYTSWGIEIIMDDETVDDVLILDEIDEIKEISNLSESEFVKLYNKYKSIDRYKYKNIFNKVEKFKYIINAEKYNL